jgi:hypothetical protein
MARRHILGIFKALVQASSDHTRIIMEPLPYKTAVLGSIVGFLLMVFFCCWAGMSFWIAGLFFTLYLMTAIAVTRVRAEVGSPIHDLHFAGPEYLIINAFGTRKLGPGNLAILPFFWFLTRAHYSDVMPHQLEGFKLADRAKGYNRRFLVAMLVATIFGTLVAFWAILDSTYRHSGAAMSWAGRESFSRLALWLSHPEPMNITGMVFFIYGLHPAGYAVSSTHGMRDYWSLFILVWLIKWLILKLGGLKAHQRVLPIFYGMIVGEFAVGGFWALFGIVFRTQTFNFTAWW